MDLGGNILQNSLKCRPNEVSVNMEIFNPSWNEYAIINDIDTIDMQISNFMKKILYKKSSHHIESMWDGEAEK